MTDTTLDAILLAVLADPQDDVPRLIYADALDEAGRSNYAEFIRVQCALAGAHCEPDCGCEDCRRRHALRRRERELAAVWDTPPGWTWVISRGFVAEVHCTLTDWIAHGPVAVRRQPVERVAVTDYGAHCYYHDPAPHQGAWIQKPGHPPFNVRGRFDTREEFAEAIGEEALQWAKRQAFPCEACGGRGQAWRDVGFKGGPERGPEKRYVAPPPRRLLFDCPACEGRGWRVGR